MALETWRLDHPEIGLIEFETGADEDFRAAYPDWPVKSAEDNELAEKLEAAKENKRRKERAVDSDSECAADSDSEHEVDGIADKVAGNRLGAQTGKIFDRVKENMRKSAQLKVNGQPVRRYKVIRAVRIPLTKHLGEELAEMSGPVDPRKPNLKIQKGLFGDVQVVTFHQAKQVAELEPPPGSRGEAYFKAVQSSALKRTTLPILAGLGKGGWAIMVLVVGPLVGRLIDWLLSFLPDFELPSLPPLPSIELPLPTFPSIALPLPDFPDFDLPELPDWIAFMMEYTKIWVPVLVGIVLGIVALRNSKKSDAQKEQWQTGGGHKELRGSTVPQEESRSDRSLFESYPDFVDEHDDIEEMQDR